jgi:hypothetical protein
VRDLVAREEAAHVAARRIPAIAEQRDLRLRRLHRHALQAADALAGEGAELFRDLGRGGGDREVVLRLDAHHPRRLRGPVGAGNGVANASGTSPKIWPACASRACARRRRRS